MIRYNLSYCKDSNNNNNNDNMSNNDNDQLSEISKKPFSVYSEQLIDFTFYCK